MIKQILTYITFFLIACPLYGYTLKTVTVTADRYEGKIIIVSDEDAGSTDLNQKYVYHFDRTGCIKDNGKESISLSRVKYQKISFHIYNHRNKDNSLFISKNSIAFQLHKRYILLDSYLEFNILLI